MLNRCQSCFGEIDKFFFKVLILTVVKTMLTRKFNQGKIAGAEGCSIRQVKKIKKKSAHLVQLKLLSLKHRDVHK